jgi:hypothetical protein
MQDMTSDALWERLETAIETAILARRRMNLATPGTKEDDVAAAIAFKTKCKAHVALIKLIDGEAATPQP